MVHKHFILINVEDMYATAIQAAIMSEFYECVSARARVRACDISHNSDGNVSLG